MDFSKTWEQLEKLGNYNLFKFSVKMLYRWLLNVVRTLGVVYALACMIFISLLARFTKKCRTVIEKAKLKHIVCRFCYCLAFSVPLIMATLPTLIQDFFLYYKSRATQTHSNDKIQMLKSTELAYRDRIFQLQDPLIILVTAFFTSILLGVYSIAIREVRYDFMVLQFVGKN